MFLFSKIVGWMLNPLLWIFILMIGAWFIKKPGIKRKTHTLALILFLFFSNNWIIQNIIAQYQFKPNPMKQGEIYHAGILLGGLTSYDKTLKEGYFNNASDRFIQTLKLYKQGYIKKIIVTGGNALFTNDDFREADFLVKNLIESGVPPEDILSERDARNTIENSLFTHRITDSLQIPEPYVLITSAFHMPRAVRIFKKDGMKVRPFPCAYLVPPSRKKITWFFLVPNTDALNLWNVYLKEQAGNIVVKITKG
jgi:uncharacterized SAM-binding protein YcdF (DUF218 family)